MPRPSPIRPVRNRIFLSSTNDSITREYRLAAREIIGSEEFNSRWIPVEMDQFVPSGASSLDECRALVLSCDVYVGLMGPFYGSRLDNEDPESVSFTEYEYKTAIDAQREIGIFLLPNEILQASSHQIIINQGTMLVRQEKFKQDLNANHMTKSVSNLEDFKVKFRQYVREKLNTLSFEQQSTKTQPNIRSEKTIDGADDRRPVTSAWSVERLDKKLVEEFLATPMAIDALDEIDVLSVKPNEHLQILGLLRNDGHLTLGAAMSFGLRQFIVQEFGSCTLHMVVYSGIKKDTADQVYRREVEDNLINLFRRGMIFFRRDAGLKRVGVVGSKSRDDLEIPELALREALANALVHRDYSESRFREQPTRIEVYRDRIEIISFGGLMEGVSLEALNNNPEKIVSYRRNPLIAKVFMYMKLVELSGSGVARMQETMAQVGLPEPKFEIDAQAEVVNVTLSRYGAAVTQPTNNIDNPLTNYVFISYATPDLDFAIRLNKKLNESGIPTWFDRTNLYIGINWDQALRHAIRDAGAVIYIVSPSSRESDYVASEIFLARSLDLPIYPVWAFGESFHQLVPMKVMSLRYIDMRDDLFEEGFQRLLEALKIKFSDKG